MIARATNRSSAPRPAAAMCAALDETAACTASARDSSFNDRRSQLLYPTEKAESLKSSKAEIEAEFYEYLTSALPADEAAAFAATLHKLYTASKTESRAGFPHFKQATEGEAEHAE